MPLHGRPRSRRLVVARHTWLRGAGFRPSPGAAPEGTGWVLRPVGQAVGPAVAPPPPNARPCRERARGPGIPASPRALPDGLLNRGVLTVQLGVGVDEAFVRLRAYAYVQGRRLADVAADVVARRLRFSPDTEPERTATSGRLVLHCREMSTSRFLAGPRRQGARTITMPHA
ncbi:ANTAR domain-containing protein [Streptomyces viridochromogenes]|uniref:ANTAR domain-containing protein n=1 Tax=Streptomyces viridochromogenes TaxID=1938 RepID=UPI003CC7C5AB